MIAERLALGGVDPGWTKCVCLIGSGPTDSGAQVSICSDGASNITFSRIEAVARNWREVHGPNAARGVASSGPIRLDRASSSRGRYQRRAAPGQGTGAALVVVGGSAYGFGHSDLGRSRVARNASHHWQGACALHDNCLEGMGLGGAITAGAGPPASELTVDNPVRGLLAQTEARLLHTIVLARAVRQILIDGGVPEGRPELRARGRRQLLDGRRRSLRWIHLSGGPDGYALSPGLGSPPAPIGVLALAAATI